MSPRERNLAILCALALVSLILYFAPSFQYVVITLALCGVVWLLFCGTRLPARLGLNPWTGLIAPVGYLLRFWDWWVSDVSVVSRRRTKLGGERREQRSESQRPFRQTRPGFNAVYRGQHLASESFLFSPRDFLMGSYIGKPESPTGDFGRPRVVGNPREQLRENLSRPNHAVCTPNRRLSFAGEPPGSAGRFNITPQRHYPLQQPGVSSVGIMSPVRWDGFRKKSVLTPRNSLAAHSPVTMKIARPDHSSPSLDHLSCAGAPRDLVDPCSRESVLKVLKESRKREVEDEDRSFTTEQKTKRRRNDSGGSAHSAFEPLLPNGAPSQLVPKPGSLKRGMTSVTEESIMKRSRTSSISSASGVHAPRGTPGSKRNPIYSSYSSSLGGLVQFKKPSAPSSPMSSPGSSRSQTPETASKRPREDDCLSPSSASSVRSDKTASEKAPETSKQTPAPKVPVTTSTDSTGSGGKRKRKIQLVSANRDDHISLPPPPELGYTVTVKDLDDEKKAAISKIQKVLETPAPELEESTSSLTSTTVSAMPASSTTSVPSTATLTLSSLLAAPLPKTSSSATPVINLDPSPSPSASNPLLEALKMKSPVNSAASTATESALTALVPPSVSNPKVSTVPDPPKPPPASQSQPASISVGQPSAFTQVLGLVSKPASSSSTPSLTGVSPFGLSSLFSSSTVVSSAANPAPSTTAATSSSESLSHSSPLLASGFKPIFAATTAPSTTSTMSAPESKPLVQNFKPIFGSSTTAGPGFAPPPYTASITTSATGSLSSSIFGASESSTTLTPSLFTGLTSTGSTTTTTNTNPAAQPAIKSVFGPWSTPASTSTSTTSAPAPATGSTFNFGAVATTTAAAAAPTTTAANSFAFGITQPQATSQKVFAFGQTAVSQNTTQPTFGGFSMANGTPVAATSTAKADVTTLAQSAFTFGKSSFEAPTSQTTFSSTASVSTASKPFTFGGSAAPPAPASNPAPPAFPFGGAVATAPSSFVTPTKPAFGGSSTTFAFGGTTMPSVAPSFGQAAQTQSAQPSTPFTFGGATPQHTPLGPTQPASGGFNFGAALSQPQFGTPLANNPAPQMGGFNFGAAADKPAFGTSTPSFGQSTSAAPGPIPFGNPGTPLQGFNAVPFGSPATPSFSIGAGSKPSGARQRLQARRQHNRKNMK
ncbi:nuclear envelope pore membrane protein POM 121 [Dunckerocampus dactyliophorus]|uniref:nuclear envelope pore membrane protein POM 121 n=1 Tax=Dunckerocampus dactyliophorus TaxID=161453 RepID=UPI00240491E7|nr:nuclear envelope pore membrane protein POM 121 [Dunckerocampus dactyliophorus]